MPRKLRDDSLTGLVETAKKAAKQYVFPSLPFGMAFDPKDPDTHRAEFEAMCQSRGADSWNQEELRHLLMASIINREMAKCVYDRDWTTANQINNLSHSINRQLGLLTKARDQASIRREADAIKKMKSVVGSDADCVD